MKEQLTQYVELLFAGTQGCQEIKQEILQNTLDRYDDLIAQGKVPEAAYRLAIAGIGDINEILAAAENQTVRDQPQVWADRTEEDTADTPIRRKLRAIAIALYILCPVPVVLAAELGWEALGICGTLLLIAVATGLIVMAGKKSGQSQASAWETKPSQAQESARRAEPPQAQLKKSLGSLIWAVGLAVYFILSFATGAWYVTWVIFLIIGAIHGLGNAILDLVEEHNHET